MEASRHPRAAGIGVAVRIGIQLASCADWWPNIITAAQACEAAGLDSIWFPDHVVPMFAEPGSACLDSISCMTAVAASTKRVEVGPLVASIFVRHPTLLALTTLTLDQMFPGRFVLGIGAGSWSPDYAGFGLPFPPASVRMKALAEAGAMLRKALRGGELEFKGDFWRLSKAPLPAGNTTPPPLLIGAQHGPKGLSIVAAVADRWNGIGLPAELREVVNQLSDACNVHGRLIDELELSALVPAVVGPTSSRAQEVAELFYSNTSPYLREQWVIGSPRDILALVEAYAQIRIKHLIFQIKPPYPLDSIESLGKLRELVADL